MRRWWLVPALAAVACREPDTSSKPPTSTLRANATAVGGQEAIPSLAEEPSITTGHETGHEKVRADHATAFEAEPVDRPWADATVREIKQVVPDATKVTCRRDQCELTIHATSDPELSSKLSALQEAQSLGGIAQAIIPTPPDTDPDGTITMRIYARFDRTQQ